MDLRAAHICATILGLTIYFAGVVQVRAQTELSLYSGVQASADSRISGNDPGGAGVLGFVANWQNQLSGPAIQYGLRLTWWRDGSVGWGLDFNRSRARADAATLANNDLSALEFSGGLNLLTLNAYRRWPDAGAFQPYIGAGIGVAIPQVIFDSGAGRTSQYQLTGPAVQWVAGARYPLDGRISLFGEYKGSYAVNNAELISGGLLRAAIQSNSLNLGVSLGF